MPYPQQDSPARQSDYTCDEYARKFNLSPTTVRNKVSRGEIPSYKIGGARRIPAEYVEKIDRSTSDLADEIKRIVDRAPELTAAQYDKLATLLTDHSPHSPAPSTPRNTRPDKRSRRSA